MIFFNSKMKILQIAPLGYPIREDLEYGSIERIIFYLDREFISKGYESIVAASGDSLINGRLLPTIRESTFKDGKKNDYSDYLQHYQRCLEEIAYNKIDIVHDNPGIGLVFSQIFKEFERNKKIEAPILTTIHGTDMDYENRADKFKLLKNQKRKVYLNSISNFQKSKIATRGIEVDEVIYHGVPIEKFDFEESKEDYLLSIGRIAP